MISERTLRQWRKDALQKIFVTEQGISVPEGTLRQVILQNERILRLTQELIDLHLMRKG